MIVGQQDAGIGNGVHAPSLLEFFVVNDVAEIFFLVGPNLQGDDVSDNRVVDFSVVQSLVRVVDRFGVNPFARIGVILDFDRQIATNRFDK